MKRYRGKLPPLDGLIFFEAAARHGSFSDAAGELLVTQTAVSKRVRQLEDHLGVALFLRSGRVIELTAEGRKLAEQSAILLDFAENLLSSIAGRADAPVRISANSAISLFWLAPRLKVFGLSDQACAVEMVSSDQPAALMDPDNDISIQHGTGDWQDRIVLQLFPDVLVPVISASLAQELELAPHQPLAGIQPALRPPLLNFARVTPDWSNWNNWGGMGDLTGWALRDCRTYARSVGAALEGQGIALANPHILSEELRSGRLLQLAPAQESMRHAYFLTYPRTRGLRPEAQRLHDFLVT